MDSNSLVSRRRHSTNDFNDDHNKSITTISIERFNNVHYNLII